MAAAAADDDDDEYHNDAVKWLAAVSCNAVTPLLACLPSLSVSI